LINDLLSFVLPTIIPAAEALIIATSYNTIRLFRKSDPSQTVAIAAIGLIAVLILNLALQYAVNVTEASKAFLKAGCGNHERHSYVKKYLNSCPPIIWNIDGKYKLNRETFPRILDEIILAVLINLLLVF